MGLAHEKKSYFQEKTNLFEFGSFEKDGKENLIFFQKPPIDKKKSDCTVFACVFEGEERNGCLASAGNVPFHGSLKK